MISLYSVVVITSMQSTSRSYIDSALKEISSLKRSFLVKKNSTVTENLSEPRFDIENVDLVRQKAETKLFQQGEKQEKRKQKTDEMPPKKSCRRAQYSSTEQ